MAMNDELVGFVKESLGRGIPRQDVEAVLARAGWERGQVTSTLAGFADFEFPVLVPRPRPNLDPRDAFLYLVLFGTLYVTAVNLGALSFELIDRAFPDPAARVHSAQVSAVVIRWAISAGRWWTMSLAEQLGNVGSEINRAAKWASKNPDLSRSAFYRALDLLDLTLDDPRHRASPARLRELARVREVVADLFGGPNQYGSTAASLQRYFDAYAVASKLKHSEGG